MQRLVASLLLRLAMVASLVLPLASAPVGRAFAAGGPPTVTLGGAIGVMPVGSPGRVFNWDVQDGGSGVGDIAVDLWQNGGLVASHSIAHADPVDSLDFSDLGTGWFKIDVKAKNTAGDQTALLSREVRVYAPLTTMTGPRAQEASYDVPIGDLPNVGAAGQTQGLLAREPTGHLVPYTGTHAYRYISDPNYNYSLGIGGPVPPYAMSSETHTGAGPLADIPQGGLRFSFTGQWLAGAVGWEQDLREEGPIPLTDSRLYGGGDAIYFIGNHDGAPHNMERRVYLEGRWQIIDAATSEVIGSGNIVDTYLFLDYTSFENTGFSRLTVDDDGKPLNAALLASGNGLLIVNFDSIQPPVWEDNPPTPLVAEQYAVYGVGATLGLLWPFPAEEPGPLPTLSIDDVSVAEGDSGTTDATFTVTLSDPSSEEVTVDFTTEDGMLDPATAGSDYVANSGTVTFAPGVTSQTVTVVVNGDTAVEPDETFLVVLDNPTNATIADGQGIGTILNDDAEPEDAPPFSGTPESFPDEVCICTPVVMNTDIAATETWYAKATGGAMDIDIIAHAVNDIDPSRVDASITSSAGTTPVSVSYTAGEAAAGGIGFEKSVTANLTGLTPGEIVRIDITTPPPTLATQPHYRLKFLGADLVGTNSPSFASFEAIPVRLLVQANAGEPIDLDFLTTGSVVIPGPATWITYTLTKPNGVTHSTAHGLPVGAGPEISVPAIGAGDAGLWTVEIQTDGHFRVDKTSGSDRGLYLTWDSGGFATKTVFINRDGVLAEGTTYTVNVLQVRLDAAFNPYTTLVATQETDTGTVTFDKLLPGSYRIEVVSPAGVSTPEPQDEVLYCDESVENIFETETTAPVEPSVSDLAWVDVDADGVQDLGEPGLSGVTVHLMSDVDTLLDTTHTDADGHYAFTGLTGGTYKLRFIPPAGWGLTAKDMSANDAIDSDALPSSGLTDPFVLADGASDTTRDAGFVKADIVVTKTADPTAPTTGQQVFYHITVTNNGPTAATGVIVVDEVSTGVSILTVGPGAPVCAVSGQTITCNYPKLDVGQFRIIEVNTNPWASGADHVTNLAVATANEPDPNPSNNSANVVTNLAAPHPVPGVPAWGLAVLALVFGSILMPKFYSRPSRPDTSRRVSS